MNYYWEYTTLLYCNTAYYIYNTILLSIFGRSHELLVRLYQNTKVNFVLTKYFNDADYYTYFDKIVKLL
jgi:hypothetical protein